MVSLSENEDMPGWPFGLGFLNMRLRIAESLAADPAEPYSMHIPSHSFSSFSTSNLDTESTASFFQDKSVSLGYLIGIRQGERRRMHLANSFRFEEREMKTLAKGCCSDMSCGICLPSIGHALQKFSKSKKSTTK